MTYRINVSITEVEAGEDDVYLFDVSSTQSDLYTAYRLATGCLQHFGQLTPKTLGPEQDAQKEAKQKEQG